MDTKPSNLPRTLLVSFFLIALSACSVWVLLPFLPSLIWSTMIVVSTWPMMHFCQRHLKGKRSLAVTAMMLAMALLVLVPVGLSAYVILSRTDDAIAWVQKLPEYQLPPPPAVLQKLPIGKERILGEWNKVSAGGAGALGEYLKPYTKSVVTWITATAKNAGFFFIHLILTLVLCGLLFAKGEWAAYGLRCFGHRLAGARGESALVLAAQAIKAVAMGIVVTALIQTFLGGAGLLIAGVPFSGILIAVMFMLCIAQLGPAIPLLIGVGWLFYKDHNLAGSLLLVWALIVGTMDNVIRPILIKKGADLPFLLILAGVLGGLLAFGVVGLFIGPVILAVTYTLLQAWVEEDEELPEVPIATPLPPKAKPQDRPLDH
ncbi:MAG: AI-2E family transporter YdiK [Bdellovibrio sp.]|nr:AI-2E family transporter YdiK [Bdellovibrio sp.]